MPALSAPRPASPWRFRSLCGIAIAAATLGGCASGDFGRTRDSAKSDDMHRWLGAEANASRGLAPSQFQLTELERQLRDQAYFFIEPPRSRPAWKSVFGDYQSSPAPWRQQVAFDRTGYGRLLIDEPHRSHMSRYNVLMDDVRSDLTRFEPFYITAARVADLDKKRHEAFKLVSGMTPRERDDAIARMKENAAIVQWAEIALEQRVALYQWALQRLVLQTPDNVAADADRLIAELAARLKRRGPGVPLSDAGPAIVSKG